MENRQSRRKSTGRKESNFVVQGSILAVAGIVVRLIGILYRVPMTNIIGDEGMGYYSTAFNVYNIMLILSSYSLPLAVSKMVSARMAKGQYRNSVRVLKAALVYATVVGGLACFITWNFADFFATTAFNTPFCVYALKTLAPTIWIMAYLGVLRGFFQGHGTMIPTAISQIFEQIVNAVISVVAASVLFKVGLDSNRVYNTTGYPQAFGAAGGTIGTGAGALAALLFMLLLFAIYAPVMKRRKRRDRSKRTDSYGDISVTFLFTVVPVIISSAVYNINAVVDNSIMAYGMESLGQGKEFLSLWGIYNNKYMLLVHVPLAMANSLSSSLIPSLSGAVARKEKGAVIAKTGLAIRFAMLIAIPSAVGLTVLSAPINNLLFRGGNNAEAIRMLIIGSAAVIFLSLSTVTNAILQGINHMNVPVRNAFISLVLHVIALYIMLMVFKMGIYSMVFANILFAVFMCVLNALAIRKYLNYRQEFLKTFLLPAVAAAFMGAAAFGVYKLVILIVKSNLIGTILAVITAVAVYGILLIKLRCIDEEELYTMPGGTKMIRISKKLRLM
ncbi:polysaccharide biosynthesis protein [[Clostridium] symbiosum]|uniref:putative polysaccharide biosynthesis protein n=1 Tax=Clostridium symbiosum TaxID=1512 RepID=UPI001D065FE6|nr:polysaccharide biosynthesis protein [[Clostridium] symbiosum]MCB6607327.1 polysaccharide biosynthesis protein [[Clostridium] symbiosum]MCB6930117.1 polysaccharide biosynthesis protein [[Clostridium] symbiosum]